MNAAGSGNAGEQAGQVANHLVIGDAHDGEAACAIIRALCRVDSAIQLNDESRMVAVKIGDEAVNHLLPTEMQAMQAIGPKPVPQCCFFGRHQAS